MNHGYSRGTRVYISTVEYRYTFMSTRGGGVYWVLMTEGYVGYSWTRDFIGVLIRVYRGPTDEGYIEVLWTRGI